MCFVRLGPRSGPRRCDRGSRVGVPRGAVAMTTEAVLTPKVYRIRLAPANDLSIQSPENFWRASPMSELTSRFRQTTGVMGSLLSPPRRAPAPRPSPPARPTPLARAAVFASVSATGPDRPLGATASQRAEGNPALEDQAVPAKRPSKPCAF
jgi:hypothetical protein